ncbi:MAG: hypothetical protein AAFU59_00310 [Pseudomonadota bacterium]
MMRRILCLCTTLCALVLGAQANAVTIDASSRVTVTYDSELLFDTVPVGEDLVGGLNTRITAPLELTASASLTAEGEALDIESGILSFENASNAQFRVTVSADLLAEIFGTRDSSSDSGEHEASALAFLDVVGGDGDGSISTMSDSGSFGPGELDFTLAEATSVGVSLILLPGQSLSIRYGVEARATVPPAPVPLPMASGMLGLALAALAGVRGRRMYRHPFWRG